MSDEINKPTIEEQIRQTIIDSMAEIHKDQKEVIELTIKKVVNGKIDKLQLQMNKQDITLEQINLEQVRVKEELKNLKDSTDPLIDIRKTAINIGKFILWLAAIVTASAAVYKLFF